MNDTQPLAPLRPWYKNERVLKHFRLTTATALRALIVANVLAIALVFWVAYANHQFAYRIQQTQIKNHAARVEDQQRTDAEIRALACILVSQTPDDPAKPIIHTFRTEYGCPPYGSPEAVPNVPPPPSKPSTGSPSPEAGAPTTAPPVRVIPRPTTVYVTPPRPKPTTVTRSVTVPAPAPPVPTCVVAVGTCITLPNTPPLP